MSPTVLVTTFFTSIWGKVTTGIIAVSTVVGLAYGFVGWHFITFATVVDANIVHTEQNRKRVNMGVAIEHQLSMQIKNMNIQLLETRIIADEQSILYLFEKQDDGVPLRAFEKIKLSSLQASLVHLNRKRNELIGM